MSIGHWSLPAFFFAFRSTITYPIRWNARDNTSLMFILLSRDKVKSVLFFAIRLKNARVVHQTNWRPGVYAGICIWFIPTIHFVLTAPYERNIVFLFYVAAILAACWKIATHDRINQELKIFILQAISVSKLGMTASSPSRWPRWDCYLQFQVLNCKVSFSWHSETASTVLGWHLNSINEIPDLLILFFYWIHWIFDIT
jgi:hypothetical protein